MKQIRGIIATIGLCSIAFMAIRLGSLISAMEVILHFWPLLIVFLPLLLFFYFTDKSGDDVQATNKAVAIIVGGFVFFIFSSFLFFNSPFFF